MKYRIEVTPLNLPDGVYMIRLVVLKTKWIVLREAVVRAAQIGDLLHEYVDVLTSHGGFNNKEKGE